MEEVFFKFRSWGDTGFLFWVSASERHTKPLQVAWMSYSTLIYVFSDTQKWENIRQRILLSFHTLCSWIFPLMSSDAVCLRVLIAVKSNVRSLVRLSLEELTQETVCALRQVGRVASGVACKGSGGNKGRLLFTERHTDVMVTRWRWVFEPCSYVRHAYR